MPTISTTAHVVQRGAHAVIQEMIALGWELGGHTHAKHPLLTEAWKLAFEVQMANDMVGGTKRMLTAPAANSKLAKSVVPSYGLTLYHHVMRSTLFVDGRRLVVNSCPFAGDCTRLCVINNNHGRQSNVRQGWRWRTDFLVRYPEHFALVLAFSIRRAVRAEKRPILFRPNVNSDIEWETIMPSLVDGSVTGEHVTYYGYSKVPTTIKGDGWVTPVYRLAFSASERMGWDHPDVLSFLERGGNVAVVTDRYYGSHNREPIRQWAGDVPVVDGDTSDEWILKESGVVGDLAFKPDDNTVAEWGRDTEFVQKIYHPSEEDT